MDKLMTQGLATDIRSLDKLRQMSVKPDATTATTAENSADAQHEALVAAAKQFESIFTQMWMKSMREANNALQDEDSPFNSRDTQFYQGMLDDQIAASVATNSHGSLADMIVKQLSPQSSSKQNSNHQDVMQRFAGANMSSDSSTPNQVLNAENFVRQNKGMASRLQKTAYAAPVAASSTESTADQHRFVRQLMPAAKMVASKMGLSPAALIAQAALETGWGKHMAKNSDGSTGNNLFGVKAGSRWTGQSTSANSLEYVNNQAVEQRSSFRSYTSVVQSMQDYADLITGSDRYQKAKEVASNPAAYFEELQAAGYATDPNYANKLKQVLQSDAIQSAFAGTGNKLQEM